MPLVSVEIEETYRSVTRPILHDVIAKLMQKWGFGQDNTRITMMGETESIPVTHSTLNNQGSRQRLDTDATILMEVTENYDPSSSPRQPRLASEAAPIFVDPILGIWITPCYRRMKTEISITLRWPDRVKAQVWRKSLDARMKAWDPIDQYQCNYHTPIPNGIIGVLHQCYLMREMNHGYNDTEGEWLKANFNPRYTLLSNQNDKGHQFAVRESQIGILGYYDFDQDGTPVIESMNGGTIHQTTFTYQLYYMRPEHFQVRYPVSIHGQLLPDEWQRMEYAHGIERYLRLYDRPSVALADLSFNSQSVQPWSQLPGIPIPYFDDWVGYRLLASMQSILRILLSVDAANPRDLINWEQLGGIAIHPAAITFMKGRHHALSTPYDHVFYINLYQYDDIIGLGHVITDGILDSKHDSDLNPRYQYHTTLDIVTDPFMLTEAARRQLFDYPEFASLYKEIVDERIWERFVAIYGDPTKPNAVYIPGLQPALGQHYRQDSQQWFRKALLAQIIALRPEN